MIISKTARAYKEGKRYIINEGGTRSGKTFGVLATLITIAMKRPGTLISVVSETYPHLRKGAIRDFESHFKSGMGEAWNKSESTYTFGNGSKIEFFSVDTAGKVHGPARDILFINEAQNISYDIARHLFVRTTGAIFIDFNPTHEFWAHTELKNDPGTAWIHSTYLDNVFLSAEQVKEIERNRHNEAWWTVYGEGRIGRTEGLVYPEWVLVDDMPEPDCVGVDFGYTNSKTAAVQVAIKDDNLYVNELLYETGLRNVDIIKKLKDADVGGGIELWCDSAEPKSIDDLYFAGLNAKPVEKTKITEGIDMVKRFKLHITKQSLNVIKELRNYQYKQDKEGNWINEPVKDFDHAMDAMRYGVTMILSKRKDFNFALNTLRGNRI